MNWYVTALIALFVGAMLAWGYSDSVRREELIEANNARAAADSVRVLAQDSLRTVVAKLGFTEKDSDEIEKLLTDQVMKTRGEVQALAKTVVTLTALIETESEVAVERDTTRIEFTHEDSTFAIRGRSVFPGYIVPDSMPPVRTTIELEAQLRAMLVLSCEEQTYAPEAILSISDGRATVDELDLHVTPRVCMPPKKQSLKLMAATHVATFILGLVVR